ncbi:PREDICTED: olfactory receptor 51E2-like [Thamnophis sirtalis]|uniref:Olfactory receptor n=1 Tax=Thamnophis sirtalis TaxID=35019 RepID=A0A6I9Z3I5_9SAUR|nr:PREDICTED: olfactory receptor 51E2-like [Thamnophis sirtalis]
MISQELSTGPPDATQAVTFTNESLGSPSSPFILSGLPGLEAAHFWLAFPLCAMYVVALVGNSIVVLVIKAEPRLHTPMYLFLGMLAGVDLVLASCTMPRVLSLLWLDSKEIAYGTCLLQMFLIHSLSGMESTILLAMAVDRYVAICRPLQYSTILTNSVAVKVGAVALVRGLVFFLPLPFLLSRLSFCPSRPLHHSYCLHQDMMNLACDKQKLNMNIVYGLIAISLVMGLDFLLILVSYLLILKAVLRLSSWEQRLRASGTCLAHLCMVLAFYVPLISLSVIHRYGPDVSPLLQAVTSNIYLLVPPVLNPIVYGARTRDIRKRALRYMRLSRNREPR